MVFDIVLLSERAAQLQDFAGIRHSAARALSLGCSF
jgi:hypothetical protein